MSDWANWEPREDFISSAYYIHFCRRMAQFARIAGRDEDILPYSEKAERLRRNFNDAWGHPDGGYHGNEMTSLAASLFFDIVGQDLRAETARKLAERVRENQWHPDFGILGAKWVPRALSANGFIDRCLQNVLADGISRMGLLGKKRFFDPLGRVERNFEFESYHVW